jgi:hypothetical protein
MQINKTTNSVHGTVLWQNCGEDCLLTVHVASKAVAGPSRGHARCTITQWQTICARDDALPVHVASKGT